MGDQGRAAPDPVGELLDEVLGHPDAAVYRKQYEFLRAQQN